MSSDKSRNFQSFLKPLETLTIIHHKSRNLFMKKIYKTSLRRIKVIITGLVLLLFSCFQSQIANAQTPTYFKGLGTSTNTIPMNTAGSHTQQIYLPSDFN